MIRVKFESDNRPTLDGVENLAIEALTHVFDNPDWHYNFHSHESSVEIIYIASGRGIYTLNNVSYSAEPNSLILINPNVIHSLSSDPQDALNAWTLTLTNFTLPGLRANEIIPPSAYPVIRLTKHAALFRQNLSLILEQHDSQDGRCNTVSLAAALTLLLLSNRLAESTGKADLQSKRSLVPLRHTFALEVIAYMDKHFREPISLESLSDRFHISAGHISHALTDVCGISPINYLISRRIGEAQWLLLTTNQSIHDIAVQVGYENTYHFSKLFIKRIGMRPQDFRSKFKQVGTG